MGRTLVGGRPALDAGSYAMGADRRGLADRTGTVVRAQLGERREPIGGRAAGESPLDEQHRLLNTSIVSSSPQRSMQTFAHF
jgi:hypothetical protein